MELENCLQYVIQPNKLCPIFKMTKMSVLLKMPCESSAGDHMTFTTIKALPIPELVI